MHTKFGVVNLNSDAHNNEVVIN